MRIARQTTLWIALFLALAVRAAAQQATVTAPEAVDSKLLLPAPPTVGSDEYKAEIEEMLAIQAARTEAQVKQFNAQKTLGLAAFDDIMPLLSKPDKLPKLNKIVKAALKETAGPLDNAKDYFKRLRPFREDSRIQALDPQNQEFSYPSGHATRGIVLAKILSQLEPDKTDALMERAREIGWNRVVGGMHHPSDIAAGRVLGQAVARVLLSDPAFQSQLKEVKEEYEAAKKPQPAAVPAG